MKGKSDAPASRGCISLDLDKVEGEEEQSAAHCRVLEERQQVRAAEIAGSEKGKRQHRIFHAAFEDQERGQGDERRRSMRR